MFNKENVDFLSVLHKQDENYTEIIKQFGQMGKTISEIKDSYTKSTSEIVILQPFEQTFAANGYRCNSIFVSDAAAADNVKLIVSLNAVTWTTNLAAGENVVNIPNQATFKATTTSGFPPSVILTRYNVPGVDNNVTVTNTPSVTLAGTTIVDGQTAPPVPNVVFNGSAWDRVRSAVGTSPQTNFSGTGTLRTVPYLFNGTNWDGQQNNTQGTLLASAARTATVTTTTQTNYNARGVIIALRVTAASGTGGLQLNVNAIDAVTGEAEGITALPSAVTANGQFLYVIYPGATLTAGSKIAQVTSIPLPRQFSVTISVGDATSYTYSVGYSLIL